MSCFPRPVFKFVPALVVAGCLIPASALLAQLLPAVSARPFLSGAAQHIQVMQDDPALINHAASGYLGVGASDIDTQRATQLGLKDARGAEIVAVDHDAPAARAGLHVHDVILSVNGQVVEGEAQLRRLLRETSPGEVVTLVISRKGQQQTLSVTLADRSTLEANAWSKHVPIPAPDDDGLMLPRSGSDFGNGFLSGLGSDPLYTGLQLDAMGSQLARFFGVHDGHGLLVRRVDNDSPGSAAGLRAGDVIVLVNGKSVVTPGQWEHVLRNNSGKSIQLTVMRDHKKQSLKLIAGHPGATTGLLLLFGPGGEFARWMNESVTGVSRELGQLAQERSHLLQGMEVFRHRLQTRE